MSKPGPDNDPLFDHHVGLMQTRLRSHLMTSSAMLFTTDAMGLYEAYLAAFPEADRQYHTCHACKHFLTAVGGLVMISAEGRITSPWWETEATGKYHAPFAALRDYVHAARVTGVFYSNELVLGTPESNGWTHLAAHLPSEYMALHPSTLTPHQAQMAKRADFQNVVRAIDEIHPDDLATVLQVLHTETLYRSGHLLGAAEWLAEVQRIRRSSSHHSRIREALLWRAIAHAPAGFCHVRSGMLGTLIDDVQARLPYDSLKARFDAKMHPLQYQRPQAAPADATIAQAEKLVEQLGIAPSLLRRFARLDEIDSIWRPAPPPSTPTVRQYGVFAHLKPKAPPVAPALELPPQTMTWEKFKRTVLPTAETIEFQVPHNRTYYMFLTTAVHADAPPILQWDHPQARNPVAWYVYHGGCLPSHAGLTRGYCAVTAIASQPSLWGDTPLAHHGESVICCLDGCHDTINQGGLALFPECLKAELHSVRSVIEAFSNAGRLEESEGPLASGIRLEKGAKDYGTFRVTSQGQASVYVLDRWD